MIIIRGIGGKVDLSQELLLMILEFTDHVEYLVLHLERKAN